LTPADAGGRPRKKPATESAAGKTGRHPERRRATWESAVEEQQHEDAKYDTPAGCFLRLFWMMIGNAILLFSACSIYQHRGSLLSMADALGSAGK